MKPPKKAALTVLVLIVLTFFGLVLAGLLGGCSRPVELTYRTPDNWTVTFMEVDSKFASAALSRFQKGRPTIGAVVKCFKDRHGPWQAAREFRDWVMSRHEGRPSNSGTRSKAIEGAVNESSGKLVIRFQDTQSWVGQGYLPTTFLWAIKSVFMDQAVVSVVGSWPTNMDDDILDEMMAIFQSADCR